ncbi:MAG: DUF5688 family protein [Eubacterium sp.]|nr:DUF5688 family protein [Eubacterium sp.]
MLFQEFADYIERNILSGWMEEAEASVETVHKNNAAVYKGLYIRREGDAATPVIYLDEYYQRYLRGESLLHILEEIRREYDWAMVRAKNCAFNLADFSCIKDKVIYRLINYEKNRGLLKECPFLPLHDLAVSFRWLAFQDSVGISTSLITNREMELWGITVQELLLYASENTPRLFPERVMSMEFYMKKCSAPEPVIFPGFPMYVMTNEQQINGASVMLYEGIFRRFTRVHPSDYYILPSSIHELILVPANEVHVPEELFDIVKNANDTVVSQDDYLSDSVYFYDYQNDCIRLFEKNMHENEFGE